MTQPHKLKQCAQTENNPNSFKLLKDKTKKTVKKVIQKKTPDILLCNSKEGVVSFDNAVLKVS